MKTYPQTKNFSRQGLDFDRSVCGLVCVYTDRLTNGHG